VGHGARLELSNIELNGGVTTGRGAALRNEGGHVSLEGCLLTNHSASGDGGAIFTRGGSLLVENSTLSGCSSSSGEGGAIFVARSGPSSTGAAAAGWQQHQQQPGNGLETGLGLMWLSERVQNFFRGISNWTRWVLSLPLLPPLPVLPSPLLGSDYGLGRAVVSLSRVTFADNFAPVGTDFAMGDSRVDASSSSSSWDPGSAFLEDDLASQWDGLEAQRVGMNRPRDGYGHTARHGRGWKFLLVVVVVMLAASFALSAAWQACKVQEGAKYVQDHPEDGACKQHGLNSWLHLPQHLSWNSNDNFVSGHTNEFDRGGARCKSRSFTIDEKGAANKNAVLNHENSENHFHGDAGAAGAAAAAGIFKAKTAVVAQRLALAKELQSAERSALRREGRGIGSPVVTLAELVPRHHNFCKPSAAVGAAAGTSLEATAVGADRRGGVNGRVSGAEMGAVPSARGAHAAVFEATYEPQSRRHRRLTLAALSRGGHFGIKVVENSTHNGDDHDGQDAKTWRTIVAVKRVNLPGDDNSSSSGNSYQSNALHGWRREVTALTRLPAHHRIISLLGVVIDGADNSGTKQVEPTTASAECLSASHWFSDNAPFWGAGLVLEWAPLGCLRDRLGTPPFVTATSYNDNKSNARFGTKTHECRLNDWVDERNTPSKTGRKGTALEPCAAQVAIDVASALAHCHAHGLVHGDVKAANVLLFPDNRYTAVSGKESGVHAKLADFGEARFVFKRKFSNRHHHRYEHQHRRHHDRNSEPNAFTGEKNTRITAHEVLSNGINRPSHEEDWRTLSTGSSDTKNSNRSASSSAGTTTSSASSDSENYDNVVGNRSRSDSGTSVTATSDSSSCTGSGSSSDGSSSGSEDDEVLVGSQCKPRHDSNSRHSTHGRGTLLYAAPEVVRRGPVRRKKHGEGAEENEPLSLLGADVWALGMVIAELRASMPLLDIWRGHNRHRSSRCAAKSPPPSRTHDSRIQRPHSKTRETPANMAKTVDNNHKEVLVVPSLLDACGWQPDLVALGLSDAPALTSLEHAPLHRPGTTRRYHHRSGRRVKAHGAESPRTRQDRPLAVAVSGAEAELGALLEKCWRASARERPSASMVQTALHQHLDEEEEDDVEETSSSERPDVVPAPSSNDPSSSATRLESVENSFVSLLSTPPAPQTGTNAVHQEPSVAATTSATLDAACEDMMRGDKPFALADVAVVTSQPQSEALTVTNANTEEDPPYMESAALLPAAWNRAPAQPTMDRLDIEEGYGGFGLDLTTEGVPHHSSAPAAAAHAVQFQDTWGAWFVPMPVNAALQSSSDFGGGFGEPPRSSI